MGSTTPVAQAHHITAQVFNTMQWDVVPNQFRDYKLEKAEGPFSWLGADYYVIVHKDEPVTEPILAGAYASEFFLVDTDHNGSPEIYLRIGDTCGPRFWMFDLAEIR